MVALVALNGFPSPRYDNVNIQNLWQSWRENLSNYFSPLPGCIFVTPPAPTAVVITVPVNRNTFVGFAHLNKMK